MEFSFFLLCSLTLVLVLSYSFPLSCVCLESDLVLLGNKKNNNLGFPCIKSVVCQGTNILLRVSASSFINFFLATMLCVICFIR